MIKYFFSTGNKDVLEEILFLKIFKKFLQIKIKLKVCKTMKSQNVTESVKNRPTGRNEFFRDTSSTQKKNSEHTKVS